MASRTDRGARTQRRDRYDRRTREMPNSELGERAPIDNDAAWAELQRMVAEREGRA